MDGVCHLPCHSSSQDPHTLVADPASNPAMIPSQKYSLAAKNVPRCSSLQMWRLRPESSLQLQQEAPHPARGPGCWDDSHPPPANLEAPPFLARVSQHVSVGAASASLPRRPVQMAAGTPPTPRGPGAHPRVTLHPARETRRQNGPQNLKQGAAPILAPRAPLLLNTRMSPQLSTLCSSSCPIGLNHSMTAPASLTQRRRCLSRLATWYLPKIPQALCPFLAPEALLPVFPREGAGRSWQAEHPSLISSTGSCSPAG